MSCHFKMLQYEYQQKRVSILNAENVKIFEKEKKKQEYEQQNVGMQQSQCLNNIYIHILVAHVHIIKTNSSFSPFIYVC